MFLNTLNVINVMPSQHALIKRLVIVDVTLLTKNFKHIKYILARSFRFEMVTGRLRSLQPDLSSEQNRQDTAAGQDRAQPVSA